MSQKVARFFVEPRRHVQVAIWVALVAVLTAVIPASGVTSMFEAPHAPQTTSSATLASGPIAFDGGAPPPVRNDQVIKDAGSLTNLLPAYRWRSNMELPSEAHKIFGREVLPNISASIATLLFNLASMVWWLILSVMQLALTQDVVTAFAGSINAFFGQTFAGLQDAGLIAAVGIFVIAGAILAWLKVGRENGSGQVGAIKSALSALLILGLLQGLGTAALGDKTSKADPSLAEAAATVPKGTPAWLVVTGNGFVDEVAGKVYTVFGAANGLTQESKTGGGSQFEVGEGTCSTYIARLYSTYNSEMAARGGASKTTAGVMSMMSYMWQQSLYTTYSAAAFGSNEFGDRIACHQLEANRQTPAGVQKEISGYGENVSTGPFILKTGDSKRDLGSLMAWHICAGPSENKGPNGAGYGWGKVYQFKDHDMNKVCETWWTSEKAGGLQTAVPNAFDWGDADDMTRDTIGENGGGSAEQMGKIHSTMEATSGATGGTRMLAGLMAVITSGVYGWSYGGPAVGTIVFQFVLLAMLFLLPWTLLLLAVRSKGKTSPLGVKLLKFTMLSFGGKILFLTLLGVTLTLQSALFALVTKGRGPGTTADEVSAAGETVLAAGVEGIGSGTLIWALLIPLATVLLMKRVLKMAGLDGVMSPSGALGFATSAMKQAGDKTGLKGIANAAGATKGGKMNGVLRKADGAPRALAGKLGRSLKHAQRLGAIHETKPGDPTKKFLSPDLANQVAAGKLTPFEARRLQAKRDEAAALRKELLDPNSALSDKERAVKEARLDRLTRRTTALPPEIADRVKRGEITARQGRALAAEMDKRRIGDKLQGLDTLDGDDPLSLAKARMDKKASVETGPVLKPLGTTTYEEAQQALEERRAATIGVAAEGSQEWMANTIEAGGRDLETLMMNTRTDGSTAPMPLNQVVAARLEAEQRNPLMADKIVMGSSGLPPVVRPSVDANGMLQISQADLGNADYVRAVGANPLNWLPPELTVQRRGETPDAYHARMNALLVTTGLRDLNGNDVNVLSEFCKDVNDDAAVTATVRALMGSRMPTDYAGDHGQLVHRVQATANAIMRTVQPELDASAGHLASAVKMSDGASDRFDAVRKAINEASKALASATGGSSTTNAKLQVEVLRRLEHEIPEALKMSFAARFEAAATQMRLEGVNESQIQNMFEEMQAQAANEDRIIMQTIASLRTSDPGALNLALAHAGHELVERAGRIIEANTGVLQRDREAIEARTAQWKAGLLDPHRPPAYTPPPL